LTRSAFREHFMRSYYDPAFDAERDAIDRLEAIAWNGYQEGRKAPLTRKAGAQFADPEYELSIEWLQARARIRKAAAKQKNPARRHGFWSYAHTARNDGTCPGEISKTFRLARTAQATLRAAGMEIDFSI
jgi:hypothetical protein